MAGHAVPMSYDTADCFHPRMMDLQQSSYTCHLSSICKSSMDNCTAAIIHCRLLFCTLQYYWSKHLHWRKFQQHIFSFHILCTQLGVKTRATSAPENWHYLVCGNSTNKCILSYRVTNLALYTELLQRNLFSAKVLLLADQYGLMFGENVLIINGG